MSSGKFTTANYKIEGLAGITLVKIRVQPETLELNWLDPDDETITITNESVTGTPNTPLRAVISSNRRKVGIHARYVYIRSVVPGQPVGYADDSVIKLPIMDRADWDKIVPGSTNCQYLNTTWLFIGKEPERIV